ncbi:prepilin-type N-terminal cleavage/methylation domain-containing protein [Testudinibacter aquarius]|uniref:Prepilin peptidase dependent protein D n=1 Tax=Testudinibacter aquarius TaxID=1524974 RepID=A0A4R3YDP8_9PAST|nr:prepilin-type N-terminal cleavage/methylation domain-containing protein [Testudinibacter aquarius]KAE9527092.1 prepilin-type N-terminal cleavage/methylation domain-containing protein [Testudinibacter aquarius]TCV90031.1 prepilin peptidase dependent protein D [Testudinibacter aquarius]TNG90551.1 prepilin-type N-terminal cleavage/methylation domain-containing protein [Testudinibacter aquarius]
MQHFNLKSNIKNNLKSGFTLVELMIVIAIIAVLATIAVPSYQSYTRKAALSELLQASTPYRGEVELCIYNTGAATGCSGGSNGIQPDKTAENKSKYIKTIATAAGKISVSGKSSLEGYGYTLTPSGGNGSEISWAVACTAPNSDTAIFPVGFCS